MSINPKKREPLSSPYEEIRAATWVIIDLMETRCHYPYRDMVQNYMSALLDDGKRKEHDEFYTQECEQHAQGLKIISDLLNLLKDKVDNDEYESMCETVATQIIGG